MTQNYTNKYSKHEPYLGKSHFQNKYPSLILQLSQCTSPRYFTYKLQHPSGKKHKINCNSECTLFHSNLAHLQLDEQANTQTIPYIHPKFQLCTPNQRYLYSNIFTALPDYWPK